MRTHPPSHFALAPGNLTALRLALRDIALAFTLDRLLSGQSMILGRATYLWGESGEEAAVKEVVCSRRE